MDPLTIAKVLEALAEVALTVYNDYETGKVVLSSDDAAVVHNALLKAEEATSMLRPQVDAALEAASQG